MNADGVKCYRQISEKNNLPCTNIHMSIPVYVGQCWGRRHITQWTYSETWTWKIDGRFHQAIGKRKVYENESLHNGAQYKLEWGNADKRCHQSGSIVGKQTCTRIPVAKYTTSTVFAQALRPKYKHAKYSMVNGARVQLPLGMGRNSHNSGRPGSVMPNYEIHNKRCKTGK